MKRCDAKLYSPLPSFLPSTRLVGARPAAFNYPYFTYEANGEAEVQRWVKECEKDVPDLRRRIQDACDAWRRGRQQ